MKCIVYHRDHGGHVTRVTDQEAVAEVKAGRAMYAPKHWLKAARRIEQVENLFRAQAHRLNDSGPVRIEA